ncbi:GLPGLI family protein [Chryseobacterium sp. PBS4-4]|uniref:GLPGLI family protein n=1 Tax=Chryseobacterium edaphi TaxID=2976532 RepID=A0ABT2W3I3_9FLAO|nr:GLPGLI family protein [Chryseobacterium edaphi]MCU7615797.1 GLPGLI family protein [Chryseobacterium edaphi]
MKYLFNFFFIFMINNHIYSQKYKVIYELTYRTDSTKNVVSRKNILLQINDNISKFYSYDFYKRDSIYNENIKLGKEAYKSMFDSNFFIINDKKNSTITKFYNFPPNSNIYKLTEIKNKFNWKILKETKKIGKYQCQKATLTYKGRDWIAWFTSDVSLNFGPYLFDGLPGAILYLEDSKQNYLFEFKSIKKYYTNNNTGNDFVAIKISKKEYVKISLDYYNDPYREMRNDGEMIENSIGELDKPNINQMTKEKQEFIRRNNNPIEISEVIKYPVK